MGAGAVERQGWDERERLQGNATGAHLPHEAKTNGEKPNANSGIGREESEGVRRG